MKPSRHHLIALALVALLALAFAGCGGGGGGDTTETTQATTEEKKALSKAELISQGDAICAEVNAAVGSTANSAAEPSTQISQIANLYVGMVSDIEQLGPPSEGASEYMTVTQAAEELAKAEGELKLASENGEATTEASSAAQIALEEFQTQSGAFGFEECSKEASAPTVAPSTGGSAEAEVEEGGIEVEEGGVEEEYVPEEEGGIEEATPEEGGAGIEEVTPEGGGEEGGSSGGVGPG